MIRLLLVSDTHYKRGVIAPELLALADRYDRVIHAGDYVSEAAADIFESFPGFLGVAGNNDSPALHARFGEKAEFKAGGVRIGICHGDLHGFNTRENARRMFAASRPDVVVFGHSHLPLILNEDGVLYINPGSASLPRGGNPRTVAELIIDTGIEEVRHIRL